MLDVHEYMRNLLAVATRFCALTALIHFEKQTTGVNMIEPASASNHRTQVQRQQSAYICKPNRHLAVRELRLAAFIFISSLHVSVLLAGKVKVCS